MNRPCSDSTRTVLRTSPYNPKLAARISAIHGVPAADNVIHSVPAAASATANHWNGRMRSPRNAMPSSIETSGLM